MSRYLSIFAATMLRADERVIWVSFPVETVFFFP